MKPSGADLALNAASAWIGPGRHRRLLQRFGSAEAVLAAAPAALCSALPNLDPGQARALLDYCRKFDAAAEALAVARAGVSALSWDGARYPGRLAQIPDPPPWIFVEGALPPEGAPAVAIVGTRKPTEYGRRMARGLATEMARRGVWVISGLAQGIDAEAHEACLAAGGSTLAVFGTGLDKVWPPEHRPLARRIVEQGGGLLSQFSMAAPGMKMHFPMRNGVISGLSLGVVVVEGAAKSGSLITADRALEQGREVFAVPGPADAPQSQGPLDLLEQGARLVRRGSDILSELGLKDLPLIPGPAGAVLGSLPEGTPPAGAGADALRLWECLPPGRGATLDVAGEAGGLPPAAAAAAATELELLGALRRLPGNLLQRI